VVLTGMLGVVMGPTELTWCRVGHPVARGVGLGTISHAQGTAAALQEGEAAGATSSLAMVAAALATAVLAPAYLPRLLALVSGPLD
jgi:putative effector of murein hydrolase